MANVVAPVPANLPPSSQVRPSSVQSADVYGAWTVGGMTTALGGTGGGGQIAGEGMAPPLASAPLVALPGGLGDLFRSSTGLVIAALIGLAVWSYMEG